MQNNFNINLAAELLSKKLGVDKSAVQNGDVNSILSHLGEADKAKIQQLMTDKKQTEQLLQNQKVQEFLKGLLDKNNG
ncbi:MAG: hypothetical protein IJW78_04455 [Clostridia bacterium]|nr:hypothetical protein [Clostridia bacterium]